MALSFAPSASRSAFVEGSSLLSVGGISTREPLNLQRPPHPLLSPLRSLLACLNLPSSLAPSSLALATPSLLLAILEALLETRIADVRDEWRGSWARDHRRGVVEVLVRAMGEVALGLTRAGGGGEAERRLRRWRKDEVDVELVVRGREGEVAKLVQGLLDIAAAMGVLARSEPCESTPVPAAGPTRGALFPAFVPPSSSPSSSPFVADASSTTPTPSLFAPRPLRPSRPVSSTSRSSAPSASLRLSSSTSASTSLTVPTHSHSHPRPLSRSTTSTTSRSSRSSTSTSTASTARPASFLSELASSPPPLSPRRRPRSRTSERAGPLDGDDEAREVSRETGSTAGRSTLERLRRAAEAHERERERREREEQEEEQERRRREKGKGKALREEGDPFAASPSSASATDCAKETPCCDGCGASLLPHARRRRRSRVRGMEEAASGDEASSSSSFAPSAGGSTAEGSTSPSPAPVRHRPRPRARRDGGDTGLGCTCTGAALPPRPPATRRVMRPPAPSSAPATLSADPRPQAAASVATSPPRRRIRVVRPPSSRPSTRHPASPTPTSATPSRATVKAGEAQDEFVFSVAKLSIHGESEIEAFERAHGRPSLSPSSGLPPPPPLPPPPARTPSAPSTPAASRPPEGEGGGGGGAGGGQGGAETPSPYTLLLLAQRDRLREKLAVLQRRERDRRLATEAGGGGGAAVSAG